VPTEVAEVLETPAEPALLQNTPGVAADRCDAPHFECVVLVEDKGFFKAADPAPIANGLAIVLAGGFQAIEFEQAPGGGEKADGRAIFRNIIRLADWAKGCSRPGLILI